MKIILAAAGALLLILLLTGLLMSGLNMNSVRYDRELQALGDFTRYERGISREVLTARAGLSRNYDGLVEMANAYDDALSRLQEAAGSDPEERAAIELLARRAARQEDLVEQFKTKNALLQNSFAYFGLFSARLGASDYKPAVAGSSALAAAMLRLTLDTSEPAAHEVKQRLDQLADLQSPAGDADSIRAILAHGRMLYDLLPATDAVLKALIADTSNREQDAVHALIVKRQLAARATARKNRLLLYAISLLLLAGLVYFGVELRARAIAMRRRAAFEHVMANISMRFINVRPQDIDAEIRHALAEMAECIGSDRAYFMVEGATPRLHVWCRTGNSFPPGWPQRAPELAARFAPNIDGIMQVPRVDRLPIGEDRDACMTFGLAGWACVKRVDKDNGSATLGFDAIERPCAITARGELGLLGMALDTIMHAVGRNSVEKERARLEASLQQARRMETIGTFASGIAHNFNNIVGAILGYAEMAHARVNSGGSPAASLAEIRRAGERARELVGQILTFGRRGEGRRERIDLKALVGETRSLLAASLPSHVALAVREKPDVTPVSAEPVQLQQVILNLCNNAAQAMDKPGVIEIGTEAREIAQPLRIGQTEVGAGRFVVISVSDPGPGMDGTTLERIFEPFFTTRPDGNGLGLATVREIVEEHDGAIEVQSAVGIGTRFDIWLPSVPSDAPISVQRAPELAFRGVGETVLVLEADLRRLLRHEEILAALGYEPVGFTTLADAVAACRATRSRFDAALVCHRPGGSALDLAASLHDAAPALPIVLATSSTWALGAPVLAASGITELVHHPLTSAELAGALSRCLAAYPTGAVSRQAAAAP
jgi:signal transduction histidine kinase